MLPVTTTVAAAATVAIAAAAAVTTAAAAAMATPFAVTLVAIIVAAGEQDGTDARNRLGSCLGQQGRERKLYLTQMAYSSVGQSAQVLADELASLLPGHPKVASQQSLASIAVQSPTARITLPSAGPQGGTVALGPGQPRLVMFFATWLSEVSDL